MRRGGGGTAGVKVWQDAYYPEQVHTEAFLRQKIDYIHLNPVKEGHVERAEDWSFSSAAWYADGSGPISIDWFDA